LQRDLGLTTIFVTHDQEEALAIADRMTIMHDGKVQQIGSPEALYEHPANLFVADFLGKMNFFEGQVTDPGRFRTGPHEIRINAAKSGGTKVGVRPERVVLACEPQGHNALAGTVDATIYLGSVIDIRVRLDSGDSVSVQRSSGGQVGPHTPGTRVHVCFDAADCVLFNE